MNVTEGKCYSIREMEDLLSAAGFTAVRFTPTTADRSLITALKA